VDTLRISVRFVYSLFFHRFAVYTGISQRIDSTDIQDIDENSVCQKMGKANNRNQIGQIEGNGLPYLAPAYSQTFIVLLVVSHRTVIALSDVLRGEYHHVCIGCHVSRFACIVS
jgi:hypothetical protein